MPKIFKKINFFLLFFLTSLFLIKILPFYYLPGINKLFSSHTLAKMLLIIIFSLFYLSHYKKIKILVKKNKSIFIPLLIFFFSQTISVIKSIDIILFWKSYHNLIISIIIFLIAFFTVQINKNNQKIIDVFIISSGMIITLLELFFFLFPHNFIQFFSSFIQKEVLSSIQTNILRGRYTLELDPELFLPFFLINFYTSKKNFFFFLFSIIVIFLSNVSNFRSRVIMSLFAVFFSFSIFFKKISFDKKIFSLFAFFLSIMIATRVSNFLFQFNIIDRFFLNNEFSGIKIKEYRISAIKDSIAIFKLSPILGVGLGNYINFRSNEDYYYKYSLTIKPYQKEYSDLVKYSPHSIFLQIISETGFLGITSFLLFLFILLRKDLVLIKKGINTSYLPYIISSWTLFIYFLFNPSTTIFVSGWFWFLRGVIQSRYDNFKN